MPLLRPTDCGLLIIETVSELRSEAVTDRQLSRGMTAIRQAAALADVPTHAASYPRTGPASVKPNSATPIERLHALGPSLVNWADSPLGKALSNTERPSIVIAGFWLEEAVTFGVLSALGEGYDTYAMFDVMPALNAPTANLAQQRLIHAGAVPTITGQVIREWAAHTLDAQKRLAILDTVLNS